MLRTSIIKIYCKNTRLKLPKITAFSLRLYLVHSSQASTNYMFHRHLSKFICLLKRCSSNCRLKGQGDLGAGKDESYTVRCHYNVVNFLINFLDRHPIAGLWGRDMGCLLRTQTPIFVLSQLLKWYIQYRVILAHVIMASDCTMPAIITH